MGEGFRTEKSRALPGFSLLEFRVFGAVRKSWNLGSVPAS